MRWLIYLIILAAGYIAIEGFCRLLEALRDKHNIAKGYRTCPRCHATVRPGVNTCEWCNMPLSMAEEIPFTDIEGEQT